MQRLPQPQAGRILLRLHVPPLRRAIHIRFQSDVQGGHILEMGVRGAERGDVRERIRIGGGVGVDDDVGGLEFCRVFQDGGFALA